MPARRRAWEVHAAPGHDPHSIILFDPISRTLISADALWENGFGIAFPELAGEPSFGEVAATLRSDRKLHRCE
jgi:glyoxylase-like metal-dependent hydrolase (beta-lactamase superfamily II)